MLFNNLYCERYECLFMNPNFKLAALAELRYRNFTTKQLPQEKNF